MRGGAANGARIRLAPQRYWQANNPVQLNQVLGVLEAIQKEFNQSQSGGKKVSLADLIVLGGAAAVEKAAKDAGKNVTIPFTPGRMDASQEQTDVDSFQYLEPAADGFRNYRNPKARVRTEELLIDKANLLTLTAPELTVLVGGMRALNANYDGSAHGILTSRPAQPQMISLSICSTWALPGKQPARTGKSMRAATAKPVSSNGPPPAPTWYWVQHAELRALAEVYGGADGTDKICERLCSRLE